MTTDGTEPTAPQRVVIICLGNAFRGDDAVGPRVADQLRRALSLEIQILVMEGAPTDLLEAWDGADLAVIVDAVRTGLRPGTIFRCEYGRNPLAPPARPASVQRLRLRDVVEMAAAMGRMPRRMVVWGWEAREFRMGSQPSLQALTGLPELVSGVMGEVEAFAAASRAPTDGSGRAG